MVPFWLLSIIRHQVFRGPKTGAIIVTTTASGTYLIREHELLSGTTPKAWAKPSNEPPNHYEA